MPGFPENPEPSGPGLAWLYSTQMFGIKLGLGNMERLMELLGNPHRAVPCIHVAGTNGKGSVCALMESALRQAGHRTGLYTSPHLVSFHERIQISGVPIPEDALEEGLKKLRRLTESWDHSPTFFEYATALAMDWFAANQCGVAVIETGMGGRLDATNVVVPEVSVLTPIDIDHAKWLGNTPSQIAVEKAGIIKPGRPAVSSPQIPEVRQVLEEAAADRGSTIKFVERAWPFTPAIKGPHQKWNAALAELALETSGFACPASSVLTGFSSVEWPARFQILPDGWVVDGAHNPHSAWALVETWKCEFGGRKTPVIFGCLADKDIRGVLEPIEEIALHFHFVPVKNERALPPEELAALCKTPHTIHASLSTCLASLHGQPCLVTGSLFLAGEFLALRASGKQEIKMRIEPPPGTH